MLTTVVRHIEQDVVKCDCCGRIKPGYMSLSDVCNDEKIVELREWYNDGGVDLCKQCLKTIVIEWLGRNATCHSVSRDGL